MGRDWRWSDATVHLDVAYRALGAINPADARFDNSVCARARGLRDLHKIGTQKDPLLVTHLLLRDPDRKPVTVRLNNDAARALKVSAAREGTTVGHLLIDAVNGIFAVQGEPESATYSAKLASRAALISDRSKGQRTARAVVARTLEQPRYRSSSQVFNLEVGDKEVARQNLAEYIDENDITIQHMKYNTRTIGKKIFEWKNLKISSILRAKGARR